jgi:hypothetical protein
MLILGPQITEDNICFVLFFLFCFDLPGYILCERFVTILYVFPLSAILEVWVNKYINHKSRVILPKKTRLSEI